MLTITIRVDSLITNQAECQEYMPKCFVYDVAPNKAKYVANKHWYEAGCFSNSTFSLFC